MPIIRSATCTSIVIGLLVAPIAPVQADRVITVVSFNVENLFDTIDDGTNPHDNTYLPIDKKNQDREAHDAACDINNPTSDFYQKQCKTLDWGGEVYHAKLERIANTILAMPALPDLIVLPETENSTVLHDLVDRHFAATPYEVILLDTTDELHSRGIDVGILTRLPMVEVPTSHVIDFGRDSEKCGKTRDILKASFTLPDKEKLTVFGVHFPSGRSPIECRIRAMKSLSELASELPVDSLHLAAGDFNFNCIETPSDAFERLMIRGNWYVSPVVKSGCTGPGSSKFVNHLIDYWHTWSFLDLILVSPGLSPTRSSEKNWFADLGSFQTLVVHPEQVQVDTDNEGYIEPRRFDPESKTGVSDHWPVGLRILPRR